MTVEEKLETLRDAVRGLYQRLARLEDSNSQRALGGARSRDQVTVLLGRGPRGVQRRIASGRRRRKHEDF
jgi:hypothetical protein